MRLDHLLSKDSDEPTVHNLRSVIWLRFALSSFEGASETTKCFWKSSLFTENCTEETRKSKLRNEAFSCTHRFSSLRSSTEESVESNRIDFPKQIRIKRKYLKSQDDDFREKP